AVLQKMRRPWFAGGTIHVASVQAGSHYLADGETAFEDGTIDYLNLPAIEIGLKFLLAADIDRIHNRVMALTDWLLKHLLLLHHSNGKPLVTIYGPTDTTLRGGTIALNFYDSEGKIFDFRQIEKLANQHNISLRTGCFCNPGAGELALNISAEDMRMIFEEHDRMTFAQFVEAMTQKGDVEAAGAVRISVGLATNFTDVYRFMHFARTFVDKKSD
ncbi:MAG: aminotransferase class V-fold PLP-dependent enzyme, partial [Anaerolineae bacterium]|nr:aminotransferase class V-fold PLP-dependent enzyme [Anaerolineae bacterium]